MADADHNLPYIVEYAKSGRSKCKHCSKDIDKDEVRLGIMIQSKFHEGRAALWHHENCFFMKANPTKISLISGFIYLKNSDQHRLLLRIKHSAKKDQNGRKRAAEGEDFRVEYAKSGRLKCGACFKSIKNSAIQVCKNVCVTKEKELCYHLDCFADNKFDLLYFDYGEELKGMDNLKKRDQELVIEKLQEVRLSKLPWKCGKYSDEESEHIKKYKKQNILFNKCLAKLENLKDVEFENLLKANFQTVPKPRHDRLLILGDMMAFGALELCPKCTKGQLVLDTNGYRCSAGTACTYVTQSPARRVMQVPAEYKNLPCFKDYTPNMEARSFLSDDVLGVDPSLSAGTGDKKQVKVHARPLKNLKFLVLEDILDGSKEISNRIKKLGGICVKSLCYDLAAYVYPEEMFEDLEVKMDGVAEADDDYEYVDTIYNEEFIEENKINVVDPYFLDEIDPIKGTVKKSAKIIVESSYVDWGMDAKSILEYAGGASDYDEGSESDDKNEDSDDEVECSDKLPPSSSSKKTSKESNQPVERSSISVYLRVPKCDVKEPAHVLTDPDNKYVATLCKRDNVDNRLSVYKLVVMENNDKTKYWLFRAWGKFFTANSADAAAFPKYQTNLKLFANASDAIDLFKKLYLEKTNTTWECRDYQFLEDEYFEHTEVSNSNVYNATVDTNGSVPLPIQRLIKVILDGTSIRTMLEDFKKTVVNFEGHYKMVDIIALEKESEEYKMIKKYVENTHDPYVKYYVLEVQEIFKINRSDADERYKKFKEQENRRLLWHSTRIYKSEVYTGQLYTSREYNLRRPAPCPEPNLLRTMAHRLFGSNGIFFTDMISDAANYAYCAEPQHNALMLLSEVALGNMETCYSEDKSKLKKEYQSRYCVGWDKPEPDMNKVLPCGTLVPNGTLVRNADRSTNPSYACDKSPDRNAYIVYDAARVNVKYMVKMKINYTGEKKQERGWITFKYKI